jgi:hypothetical protein
MKIFLTLLTSTIVTLGLIGCGGSDAQSESVAPADTKTVAQTLPDRPKTGDEVSEIVKEAVMNQTALVETKMSEFKMPDLTGISADKLGQLSAAALTNLAGMAGAESPGLMSQLNGLKSSLSAKDPIQALGQLKEWAAMAQQIPGAAAGIEATKGMVSAWALKQGFDAQIINPVLSALQAGDLGRLAAQAAKLSGTMELTDQQVQILNGVLSNYGIDAKAGEVLNSVKGLFGR